MDALIGSKSPIDAMFCKLLFIVSDSRGVFLLSRAVQPPSSVCFLFFTSERESVPPRREVEQKGAAEEKKETEGQGAVMSLFTPSLLLLLRSWLGCCGSPVLMGSFIRVDVETVTKKWKIMLK